MNGDSKYVKVGWLVDILITAILGLVCYIFLSTVGNTNAQVTKNSSDIEDLKSKVSDYVAQTNVSIVAMQKDISWIKAALGNKQLGKQ